MSKFEPNLNFVCWLSIAFWWGKNTVPTKQYFDRWYADFKLSCTNTNDTECSGHPNSAVVLENIKNFTIILADHKLKLREIAEELKISEGNVFTILHELLSMRKLYSQWVPCFLTVDQKQQHINNSECCLQLFQHKKKEFLHKYVTMNETWIYHFTPESNWQSAEWTAAGESCPKWPKTQTSAGKVLASVFWGVQGIFCSSITLKGRIINSNYYIALSVRSKEESTKRRPPMKKKKCSFTTTMHHLSSPLQRWQNYINRTSNCFCTHPILQICPPVTTGCLQTSKECSRERDLAPMKK